MVFRQRVNKFKKSISKFWLSKKFNGEEDHKRFVGYDLLHVDVSNGLRQMDSHLKGEVQNRTVNPL